MQNSVIASAAYLIQPVTTVAPAVTFTPASGTYPSAQSVTLSDGDANAEIYYTTDGSAPSASSTLYASAIQVSTSETINAIAIDPATQNSNIATASYIIQQPANPTFSLGSSAMTTIKAGSSSTATVTISPSGGFTGTVALTCSLTSNPSGAANLPTCSIDQSASIAGSQPATATLTIKTTGTSSAAVHNPMGKMLAYGGEILAAVLFVLVPIRRRRWQSLVGMVLLVFLLAGVGGCGGTTKVVNTNTGTTAGNYVITVTGTSGTTVASTTVPFTVQ